MVYDNDGIFWQDALSEPKNKNTIRPLPPIPDTGWTPPRDFPNLHAASVLGIDCETYDPQLTTHGPGWARGVGHIVGFSVATTDGHSWYFPIRHEVQRSYNMDTASVIRYMRDLMKQPMPKVGANILYDIGWMAEEDIKVNGVLYDVLYAEAIIFDTASNYSLDSTASRWLGLHKQDDELYKWCAQAYGGVVNRKQAANIYRAPPSLVGPYAEVDAELPLKILPKQWEVMHRDNLLRVFNLETELIPVLLGMRQRGIPVSRDKAELANLTLQTQQVMAQHALNKEAGFEVEVYTSDSLVRLFDSKGLTYPRTEKGAPSFTKDWLASHTHPIGKLVQRVRRYDKARGTFIQGYILDKETNGRIYPTFHPLRGEKGGAVSGRYSSSDPNAQNIPSRDKEIGDIIRSCFIPENGMEWVKQDLSQIEYRLFAHYSGDQRLINEYLDPATDYHNVVSGFLGDTLPRGIVKNLNFGSLYGMGVDKMASMLAALFTKEEAEHLLLDLISEIKSTRNNIYKNLAVTLTHIYETSFPAAKQSLNRDMAIAEKYGEIRTILGRRSTFDLWEPTNIRNQKPLRHDAAIKEYGAAIKRANGYRALNRRLQGSAADLLKTGMLNAYKEGIFNKIGFPHVTVHDELDNSYHPDLREYFYKLQLIIESAIHLRVPVILGAEIGCDWGHVKKTNLLA